MRTPDKVDVFKEQRKSDCDRNRKSREKGEEGGIERQGSRKEDTDVRTMVPLFEMGSLHMPPTAILKIVEFVKPLKVTHWQDIGVKMNSRKMEPWTLM